MNVYQVTIILHDGTRIKTLAEYSEAEVIREALKGPKAKAYHDIKRPDGETLRIYAMEVREICSIPFGKDEGR